MATGLRSVIPEVAAELGQQAGDIVEFVIQGVESNARAAAPIRTGLLANANDSETSRFEGGAEGQAYNNVEYAAYVNFGTGARGAGSNVPNRPDEVRYTAGWTGMPAQPFMSEAAEIARDEWTRGWADLEARLPHL